VVNLFISDQTLGPKLEPLPDSFPTAKTKLHHGGTESTEKKLPSNTATTLLVFLSVLSVVNLFISTEAISPEN
jgi:hypothetical protein